MDRTIRKITWADFRPQMDLLNSALSRILLDLCPPDSHQLYVVTYRFGDLIVKDDQLQLPMGDNGELQPITASGVDPNLREDISHCVGFSIDNQVEAFTQCGDYVRSLTGLLPAGTILPYPNPNKESTSLYHYLPMNISAGARNIFMLPKVSREKSHRCLFHDLQSPTETPTDPLEQWHTFRLIANRPELSDPWQCTMVFFSKEWFSDLRDPTWQAFNDYVNQTHLPMQAFLQNRLEWDLLFSTMAEKRNAKPYDNSIVKQVFAIAAGGAVGFIPAVDNTAAPVDLIQQSYIENYGLEEYMPTMLYAKCYNIEENEKQIPVYYSLSMHSATDFLPRPNKQENLSEALYKAHLCLKHYQNQLENMTSLPENSIPKKILKKVKMQFYHHNFVSKREIRNLEQLLLDNPRFNQVLADCQNKQFAMSNKFTRSCIALMPSNSQEEA